MNPLNRVRTALVANFIFSLSVCVICSVRQSVRGDSDGMDLLLPYLDHHGPKHRTHRQVRECQHIKYGNITHSKLKAHNYNDSLTLSLPITETHHMIKPVQTYYFQTRDVYMHYTKVNNPMRTVSVLEPLKEGGCKEGHGDRATVLESAKQKNCIVAINAGFFNTNNGACYGNIVSDGQLVQDSGGIQNAHFGITKRGDIYTGYLSEIDLVAEDFLQLVGGVIWLVRDGQSYINESIGFECSDAEETGTLQQFASTLSARTAIGHDKEGRVIFLQAEGKTHNNGLTLIEFVDILLEFGVVNAINLDGGGSGTFVVNGTLANYPSDECQDNPKFNCARNVSTIVCVHEPDCQPKDCSGHGTCVLGECVCTDYWTGKSCDTLSCPDNCHGYGKCTESGCICNAGWHGYNCNMTCSPGTFGVNCQNTCTCIHGSVCDPVNGVCVCDVGYDGKSCEKPCPFGRYGAKCEGLCLCDDGCPCHPETGSCDYHDLSSDIFQAGQCYADKIIAERHLVPDQSEEYQACQIAVITVSVFAFLCIIVNIYLAYKVFKKPKHKVAMKKRLLLPNSKHSNRYPDDTSSEEELSSFSDYPMVETSFNGSVKTQQKR